MTDYDDVKLMDKMKLLAAVDREDEQERSKVHFATAFYYLPQQVMDNGLKKIPKKSKNVPDGLHQIYRNSKEIHLYGKESELKNNLTIYRNFIRNHNVFDIPPGDLYNREPIFYKSLKKTSYICKNDIFVFAQEMLRITDRTLMRNKLLLSMVVIYLKRMELKLGNALEFVACSRKDLEGFFEVEKLREKFSEVYDKHFLPKQKQIKHNLNLHELFLAWKKLLPEDFNEDEGAYIKKVIEEVYGPAGINKSYRDHYSMIDEVEKTVTYFEEKFKIKPEWSLSNDQLESSKKSPMVMRIFDDYDQKFVMLPELLKTMKMTNIEIKSNVLEKLATNPPGMITTVSFKECYEIIGRENISKIDFLHTPIVRAKHAAVPIATHGGRHCILAADALIEMLRDLIQVKRIFQRAEEKDREQVETFLNKILLFYLKDYPAKVFVDLNFAAKLRKECDDEFEKLNLKNEVNEIESVDYSGFDQDRLEKELKHLNLIRIFPDILGHAKIAFEKLLHSKFQDRLRINELFDAIGDCQLFCISKWLPKLNQFLHSQQACFYVLNFGCIKCNAQKSKHGNTTWKEYTLSDVSNVDPSSNRKESDPPVYFSDYVKIMTIHQKEKQNLDGEIKMLRYEAGCVTEFKEVCKQEAKEETFAVSGNERDLDQIEKQSFDAVERFAKRRNRKMYIRTLLDTLMEQKKNKRILIEEIISMLPYILKQQGSYTKQKSEKLDELKNKWKRSSAKSPFSTVSIPELKRILEDFDVDKNQIFLIPDLRISLFAAKTEADSSFSVFSSLGKLTSVNQSCFHLFETVVCEYDWSLVYHCPHIPSSDLCICGMKEKIIGTMRTYLNNDGNSYIFLEDVLKTNEGVRNTLQKFQYNFSSMYSQLKKAKKLSGTVYLTVLFAEEVFAQKFNGFLSEKELEALRKIKVDGWRVVVILMISILTIFLGTEHSDIYSILMKCIAFEVPVINLKGSDDLENFVVHGGKYYMMTEDDIANFYKEFQQRRNNSELMVTAEDFFQALFEDIKNGTALKTVQDNKQRFESAINKMMEDSIDRDIQDVLKSVEETVEEKSQTSSINKKPHRDSESSTEVENAEPAESTSDTENPHSPVVEDDRNETVENPSTTEPTVSQKPSTETRENGVEWCKKCFRTSQILEATKTKYRTKKGEAKELSNKLKEVQKELEEKNEREHVVEDIFKMKYQMELEGEKSKVKEETLAVCRTAIGIMKSENIRLTDLNSRLEKKNEENEIELINLREENKNLKENYDSHRSKTEREVLSKARIIENNMKKENQKLLEQVFQLTKQLESLKHQKAVSDQNSFQLTSSSFSASPSLDSQRLPPSQGVRTENLPVKAPPFIDWTKPDNQQLLIQLRYKRMIILGDKSIDKASEKVRRLIMNNFNKETKGRAYGELGKFKMTHTAYLKALNRNIAMIENSPNIPRDQLPALPEEPRFSDWLNEKYQEHLEEERRRETPPSTSNQPSTSSSLPNETSDELEDKECLICLMDRTTIVGTLKCFSCKRRYHDECISPWLNTNSICPTCRKPMLDPNEFPALS